MLISLWRARLFSSVLYALAPLSRSNGRQDDTPSDHEQDAVSHSIHESEMPSLKVVGLEPGRKPNKTYPAIHSLRIRSQIQHGMSHRLNMQDLLASAFKNSHSLNIEVAHLYILVYVIYMSGKINCHF